MEGAARQSNCIGDWLKRVKTDESNLCGALNACSHGGLVDLGFEIFESMAKVYRLGPKIKHYGCMIDLLGRLGRLQEAYEFDSRMKIVSFFLY